MRISFALMALMFLLIAACQTEGDIERFRQDPSVFKADRADLIENGERYYARGAYHRALAQYKKLLKLEPSFWVAHMGTALCHYQLGKQLGASGKLQDAYSRFQAANEIFSDLWDGTVESSTQLEGARQFKVCMSLAQNERATGFLDTLRLNQLEKFLASATGDRAVKIQAEQARLRKHRSEVYTSAILKFRKLVAMDYPAPDAILNLADLELVTLQDEQATIHYIAYLDLCRTSIARWRNVRDHPEALEAGKNGQERVILESNKKIVLATKKAVFVLEKLAAMYFKGQAYKDALVLLEEALKLDPSQIGLRVNMAECMGPLGQYRAAVRNLELFLLDSSPFDARKKKAVRMRAEYLAHVKKSDSSG